MSIATSIANLFTAKPAQAPAVPAVPAVPVTPTNNLANADPAAVAPQGEVTPLDKFADVWQSASNENAVPAQEGITSQQMMEAAGKVDFSRLIDSDTMARINGGGEEAMRALVQVINKTSQTSFGQSMVAAQKLIEAAVGDAKKDFSAQIPGMVKNQQLRESIYEKNQALKNPAVSPIVEALQNRLAGKYPKASVQELNSMAEEMMLGAAQAFAPQVFKKPEPKVPKDQDWSDLG